MLAAYAWVVVDEIHANYINIKLDEPISEIEIDKLRDPKHQFILWPRQDIILDLPAAHSTSPVAHSQRCLPLTAPSPLGPSQLVAPPGPCGSTPTFAKPLSPPCGPPLVDVPIVFA